MERLCLDFVNSEFHNFRGLFVRDDLRDPAWRARFLQRWHLPVDDFLDEITLARLIELRTLLFRAVKMVSQGQPIAEQDLVFLNERLRHSTFTSQITRAEQGYRLVNVPATQDWHRVQSEIIADFVTLLMDYEPQRLKICANQQCFWVFYDETKSRTRRYCSTSKCANLMKLRRFRARKKAPQLT